MNLKSTVPPLNKSPVLVIGGAFSGKSRFATSLLDPDQPGIVLGTAAMTGSDSDRISQLKAERPAAWETVEGMTDLTAVLKEAVQRSPQVLLDSVNQWLAQSVWDAQKAEGLASFSQDFLPIEQELMAAVTASSARLVIVTSEFGQSLPPNNPAERTLRMSLGRINQALAACCPTLVQVVAGIPQLLKQG